MHEFSIAQSILAIAEDYAKRNDAISITIIGVRVGDFSGVVPIALKTAFDVVKKGSLAEHAELKIETIPLVAFCQNCQKDFEVTGPYNIAYCPKCQILSHDLRQGQELDVSYLEVN